MAPKRITLRTLASILLLAGAILAINAQTALAQAPQGLPTAGPRTSSSAAAVWFKQYCAACHGVDGTGDGPVAQSLRTRPANLTVLSKNNGGVFPEQEVHDFIDGTRSVAAHGSQQMPVWGYAFGPGALVGSFKPGLSREEINTKINLLVDYLKSIQKK